MADLEDWIAATLERERPEEHDELSDPAQLSEQELLVRLLETVRKLTPGDQRGLVFPRGTSPIDGYGTQNGVQTFAAGDAEPRAMAESQHRSEYLWGITAVGDNVAFDLNWGTKATHRLADLRSPLAVAIPGNFALNCRQVNPALGATALCTLTAVGSRGVTQCRQVVSVLGALSPFAVRATALSGATVTIAGTAVALAAGASVDVVNPASLTAGGPILVDLAI